MEVQPWTEDDEYDFEDIDCVGCGMKFFVRPSLYTEAEQERRERDGMPRKEWPTKCGRCEKGLPPLYEF